MCLVTTTAGNVGRLENGNLVLGGHKKATTAFFWKHVPACVHSFDGFTEIQYDSEKEYNNIKAFVSALIGGEPPAFFRVFMSDSKDSLLLESQNEDNLLGLYKIKSLDEFSTKDLNTLDALQSSGLHTYASKCLFLC